MGSDGVDLKPRSLVTILWNRSMQTHCVGKSSTWLSILHSQKITVIIAPFWHLIPVTTHLRSSGQWDPACRVRKHEAVPSIMLCLMAWTNQQDQHSASQNYSGCLSWTQLAASLSLLNILRSERSLVCSAPNAPVAAFQQVMKETLSHQPTGLLVKRSESRWIQYVAQTHSIAV